MAYRTLTLKTSCTRISALSARNSSTRCYSISDRPLPPRLLSTSSSSRPQSTTVTSQTWINSYWTVLPVNKKIAIVGGAVALGILVYNWKDLKKTVGLNFGFLTVGLELAKGDDKSKEVKGVVRGNIPCMPRPSHFQPRTGEVRKLRKMFDTLEKNNPGILAKTVYITGEPAMGKSQLAGQFGREFFERNKPKNKNLFVGTLSADSRSTFLDTYRQMALDLCCVNPKIELSILSGQLDELQSLKTLSDHVRKDLRERPGWLLIIDGLSLNEKLEKELSPFWPQPNDEGWGKGCVLVTTQGHAPEGIDVMDLRSGMSEKDAVELLTRVSGCSDKEEAVDLVKSLDRSPLSVACAGTYIKSKRSRNSSYSFKDYAQELTKEGAQDRIEQQVLKRQQHPFPRTRKTAVRMAAEQLASDNPSLHKVFDLLAICTQAPVPLRLVARVLDVQQDNKELEDVEDVCDCTLLSPVELVGGVKTVSVHQVTRSVFKDLFQRYTSTLVVSDQRKHLIQTTTDSVCQVYDAVSKHFDSSPDSFQMMKLLIPHMENLLKIQLEVPDFHFDPKREVKLLFALGKSYQQMGCFKDADMVSEKALRMCTKEGIEGTKKGAEIATLLAWSKKKRGLYKETERILNESLETVKKQCGEESVEVAGILDHLGVYHTRMHDFHKSRKCLESALKIYENRYGPEHHTVAQVLLNLGIMWKTAGNKSEAIRFYQKALCIQRKIYDPNHPKVAKTLNQLGLLLGGENGIDLLKQSLNMKRCFYGDHHREIARTLNHLSETYHDQGDIQNAKQVSQDAFDALTDDPDTPMTADVQYNSGMILLDLEEFEAAQRDLQSCFATHKAVYGIKDKRTMRKHLGVVQAARLAGNLQHAKEILETAEDSLLDFPDIQSELGKVYLDLGYFTKSLQGHGRALDIAKEVNSDKPNLQIAFRRADLAQALWGSGEVRSGLEMMQHALKEYQQSTDSVSEDDSVTRLELEYRNTEYVLMLVTLSQMLQDTGNLEEARGHLDDALDNLNKSSFHHNLVKAKTICTLGIVFHKLAAKASTELNPVAAHLYPWYYRYKARKLLNNALHIMRKARTNHPNTATILAAIGRVDLDSGDLHSAKHHLEEAIDIQTKCCGSIHPNIALYHQLLAEVASQTGDELSAKAHTQEADKIYKTLIMRESEMSKRAGIKLPILQNWQECIGNSCLNDGP